MSYLDPLNKEQLKSFDFLLEAVEQSMGFVPNSMKTMARVPAILGGFSSLSALLLADPKKLKPIVAIKLFFKNLSWVPKFIKQKERVPLYLRNLVAYASSNAAGCRYCQAHTIGEALHNGVPEHKIKDIWRYEESEHYDEKERSAIRFAIAAGSVPNVVTKDHFVELNKHFSDEEVVELGSVISLFGFLNRWNDTFATQLEEKPRDIAEKYLGPQGWSIGKH